VSNSDHQHREESPACEDCDGSGIRDPSTPSCSMHLPEGWHVLERCDACQRFASDLDAARQRYGDRLRIVVCDDGGGHVVVPDPSPCGASGCARFHRVVTGIVGAVRRRLILSSRFLTYLYNTWETFS
jgi:hypothetical protein